MIKIGITGGIGSGKSVVSALLRLMDIPVYDTDKHAKDLQTSSPALRQQITHILGEEAYLEDGSLNKAYIAGKIFSDKGLLAQINAVVHPAVLEDFNNWVTIQQKAGCPIVGLESAILHQARLNEHLDIVWNVEAPVETCIARACRRDNKNREQIEARIRNQHFTQNEGEKQIINDDHHSLIEQVSALITEIKKVNIQL